MHQAWLCEDLARQAKAIPLKTGQTMDFQSGGVWRKAFLSHTGLAWVFGSGAERPRVVDLGMTRADWNYHAD